MAGIFSASIRRRCMCIIPIIQASLLTLVSQITPDPTNVSGYAVRSALLDIIDIFEVNRKDAARLLMEYPKWTVPGTFKPKPGAPGAQEEEEEGSGHNWQLESTIIEVRQSYSIFSSFLIHLARQSSERSLCFLRHRTSPSITLLSLQSCVNYHRPPSGPQWANQYVDSTQGLQTVWMLMWLAVSPNGSLCI